MIPASRPVDETPKRVLLVWEHGAGRTHYGNLLSIARHLRKAGVECLASLHNLSAADREFAAIGIRTVQAFVWPGQKRSRAVDLPSPDSGFTDFLASLGLASAETVAGCIAHYDGLFSLFRPDMIVADHGFGAVLAGRDHMPVMAMASSGYMPPIVSDGFPLMPGFEAPAMPVETLLRGINAGLGRAGRFPLRNMADLLRPVTVAALGPAEYDVYASHRRTPVLPPLVPVVPPPQPLGERNEVFVYLHTDTQLLDAPIAALSALDLPLRIYLPGMTEATRRRLAHCTIHDEPVPVDEIVARSRCVVHHGGTQLSAICIATGTPQVILSKFLDNRVATTFVEERGIGEGRRLEQASADWIGEAVLRAYSDEELRRRCEAAAPHFYARWFTKDTAAILAEFVLEQIGVKRQAVETTVR